MSISERDYVNTCNALVVLIVSTLNRV